MSLKDELKKASFEVYASKYKGKTINDFTKKTKVIPLSALKKICEEDFAKDFGSVGETFRVRLFQAISEIEKEVKK